MNTYKITIFICKRADSMIKMFWWSANDSSNIYLARKKWKDICKTKELGGVGFRSFKEMNNSMLAKLG